MLNYHSEPEEEPIFNLLPETDEPYSNNVDDEANEDD